MTGPELRASLEPLLRPTGDPVVLAYLGGETLREVGEQYGLSPQGVRNRVRRSGHKCRPRGRPAESPYARDVQRFVAEGMTRTQIAQQLGITPERVRHLIGHRNLRRRSLDLNRADHKPTYTDGDILKALQVAAAQSDCPLRTYAYIAAREDGATLTDGRPLPSMPTVLSRWDTDGWVDVLERAGLPTTGMKRGRGPGVTREIALDALTSLYRRLGYPPTVREYEDVYRAEGWPSPTSVRRRLGGAWNEALKIAREEVNR